MMRVPALLAVAAVSLLVGPAGAARTPPPASDAAAALVSSTRASVTRFEALSAAEAAGYELASVTGPVQHWLNPAYLADGHPADPWRPAGLVYADTGHGLRLAAAMFVLSAPGVPDPPIPGAVWHHHTWCQGAGGIGVPLPGGPCPPGTQVQTTPDMLHVWFPWVGIPVFATTMTPTEVCHLGAPTPL